MPKIRLSDVSVSIDGHDILTQINLELTEQRIGIIGANGGGKSTLIRLINGLGEATSGSVTVDGIDVAAKAREVRRRVGFVFADAETQIVMPNVRDDVAFSLRRLKLPRAERERRVNAALERFHLTEHADKSPHVLSGGQKQLLALAAVLVMEPDVIIADEPTTLLDLRNRKDLKRHFDALEQQLIVVSHDLDFLTDFDRVLCLDNQRVVADGTPKEVISYYQELMA
ncbi:ABC transporter ATP-binding protein [Corynebacterium canis]|uniref:ABC transporter ATP-binding protein n=1 Tax=Corynebacterium canis TaxID=679663 RepID=A0A5C5UM23_9CORY|nr:ABC transporter ATP-binding protein [Corynebacterium canis]TWT26909.1 ABC transporter ATP-binding protein [Corynebacterium canis]WJY75537.1 Biotin transport ATP-binding protein BioM [Corynebacterium canis]